MKTLPCILFLVAFGFGMGMRLSERATIEPFRNCQTCPLTTTATASGTSTGQVAL